MVDWYNATGRPLASSAWLDAHHRAKLPERTRFARMLAESRPTRVVDVGCATGLWLELLDSLLPPTCEFIGLDSDPDALALAAARASRWSRRARFEVCDIESHLDAVPSADLTLLFNVMPYVSDPARLLSTLAARTPRGTVAVRQYDGASLRFGPMPTDVRALIEASLRSSVAVSARFRHYDMDRVFAVLGASPFAHHRIAFELFERIAPFPTDFVDYFLGTLAWTRDLISDEAAVHLRSWQERYGGVTPENCYFFEVDVTAVLS